MSGLVFASMIKARLGIPVVLNVSCRDRNRFALKSDLLGAAALGIDAVGRLAGRQDRRPTAAPARARSMTSIPSACLQMIADLNRGDTGEGKRLLKTLPQLVPGVVGNPNRKHTRSRIRTARAQGRGGRALRHHAAGVRSGHGAAFREQRASPRTRRDTWDPAGQARIDGDLFKGKD